MAPAIDVVVGRKEWFMEPTRLVRSGWRHPGVRSDDRLTLGERAADRMRNGMGSWAFVFDALIFIAAQTEEIHERVVE